MKEFTSLTGPWVGQSIQEGFRITEKIMIAFKGNAFTGSGSDLDGDFDLEGEFDPADQMVNIIRRYTVAPRNPSQIGYAFIYIGRWDGHQVTGRWMMSTHPGEGGSFEMWPESEEEAKERAIESFSLFETLTLGQSN